MKVYFLGDGELGVQDTYIKIGKSTDPASRMINLQTGNPRRLRIFTTFEERLINTQKGDVLLDENYFHRIFKFERIDGSEWFRYSPALERGILWLHLFGDKLQKAEQVTEFESAVTGEFSCSEIKSFFTDYLKLFNRSQVRWKIT